MAKKRSRLLRVLMVYKVDTLDPLPPKKLLIIYGQLLRIHEKVGS